MKKGSLSLSMNAIVILILAITLLGLGLSFMRGMFGKMTEKMTAAVNVYELENPPTDDNQFTVAPPDLLSKGDTEKIIFAFLNNDPSPDPDPCALDTITCQSGNDECPEGIEDEGYLTWDAENYDMKRGQVMRWTVAVAPADSGDSFESAPPLCTYLCSAVMDCGDYGEWKKEFILTYSS